MRKKLIFAAAAMLALSGCLTWGEFDANLAALKGRPAKDVFDLLGYPDQQQQFGDETVYSWFSNSSGALVMPTTSTTTAYIGAKPVTATTTGTQVLPVNYACKLKLVADPAGVIQKYQYEGDAGGCEPYMRALYKAARR